MSSVAMQVPAPCGAETSPRAPVVVDSALIVRHTTLVKRIALHLSSRLPDRVLLDDLIQAGLLGLVEAAAKFDPEHGVSFEAFASARIRGAMWDEARRTDWTPRSVHRKSREVSAAMCEVQNRLGRPATDAEVADALGVDAESYATILNDAQSSRLLSLDAQWDEHDGPAMMPEDEAADPLLRAQSDSLRDRLTAAIGCLPERDQLLLALYYNEELNLREIGRVLDVTESRVCQLHGRAVLRLRGILEAEAAE